MSDNTELLPKSEPEDFVLFNFLLTSYSLLRSKSGLFPNPKEFAPISIDLIYGVSLENTIFSPPLSNISTSSPFCRIIIYNLISCTSIVYKRICKNFFPV